MRLQHVTERAGVARRDLAQQPQHGEARDARTRLAGELGQAQQPDGGARGAGGNGGVLEVLAPHDQLFAVGGGGEEAAVLLVGEARDQLVGQLACVLEPALLAARFKQRQQRLQQEGVVLQVGADLGLAVVVGAQQTAVCSRACSSSGSPRSGRRRRDSRLAKGRHRHRPARRSSARSSWSAACRRAPGRVRGLARLQQALADARRAPAAPGPGREPEAHSARAPGDAGPAKFPAAVAPNHAIAASASARRAARAARLRATRRSVPPRPPSRRPGRCRRRPPGRASRASAHSSVLTHTSRRCSSPDACQPCR